MFSPIFQSGPKSEDTVIRLEHVSKQFPSSEGNLSVLQNVSLAVEAGKILSIVGKSGMGKSTLLNIIGGLEKASSGTVSVRGSIGYVPQEDLLLPWRTVLANILLPVEIQRGDFNVAIARARDLLRIYGMDAFEAAYPAELSGGMRQKISLIRTLVQDPSIMLFDEPFSAIDFDTRLSLVRDIRALILSTRKTGVFVTHNLEEAIAIADSVIVLGNRPAHILLRTDIDIQDKCRDPIAIRKNQTFQALFEQIWKLMGTSV